MNSAQTLQFSDSGESACWQIHLIVSHEIANTLSDTLLACGALSVSLSSREENELANMAYAMDTAAALTPDTLLPKWVKVELQILFASKEEADVGFPLSLSACDLPINYPAQGGPLQLEDWVQHSQHEFPPQYFPPRLNIVSTWHPRPAGPHLILDPGRAFGTGTHPTTSMCLSWISQKLPSGMRVLDFGCGSGILAAAAAFLEAGEVWATDIDPQALETCAINARKNNLTIHIVNAERPIKSQFQVVLANILSAPLKALAPYLCARVSPGGHLLLSGILARQQEEVCKAYAPWLNLTPWALQDGWVALVGQRS